MNINVLVTGGAGYIGTHTVRQLQQCGYGVVILDNLKYGHKDIVEAALSTELITGDIGDRALLDQIFATYDIQAVVHFAAYAYVGESVKDPAKYYRNNVGGSLTLLEAMVAAKVKKIIFSSTCASYGIPDELPIQEESPQNPINPYGQSKLMVEKIIQDFGQAYGLKSICFRYFNAAGAHPDGDLGEDHDPEPHLIPKILYAALGKGEGISIFGTDYPTPDGTCVRDYVHVVDLARAHVMGLDYLMAGGETTSFNLGTGHGFSVREMIDTAREITGKPIDCVMCDRRPGDPPILIADATKASQVLGWKPQYSNLKTILGDAWAWHQKRHNLPTRSHNTFETQTTLPLVSVVIPAYNGAQFIERTLNSVINQTYQNLEILVVDDGSTDDTADIVQQFAVDDPRIQLLQQENAGVAAARNHGILKSTGEYIAPVDADDIWHSTNIEKQVHAFSQSDETVGMVYSWSVDIDEDDYLTGGLRFSPYYGNVYSAMLYNNLVGNGSACMFRRSCLDAIGLYSTELRAQHAQGCEDWDIYLRTAKQYQIQVVPELLVGYRQVSGSMSAEAEKMIRSRELTLQPMAQQFPRIYAKVLNWRGSVSHIRDVRICLSTNKHADAWRALWKSLKADWLLPLSTYITYKLFLQVVWGYLRSSLKFNSSDKRAASPQINHTSRNSIYVPDAPLVFWLKVHLKFIFALLPRKLITFFRIRWIASRVAPDSPLPKSLPLLDVYKANLVVVQKAQASNCRLEFGQDNASAKQLVGIASRESD